ncbi:hypothetical protein TNIN_387091 [Trichonephila inaurata madagascariensis]|uniref:Uncharacterized protein n=1 Tax=Trichonephila inaurata madagascariensis TaxID=2747483 RepID=A0A8X6XLL8_9ARAC|nr:hypothetical protein TNIN_387091 [Trichonephila inaurata madagascariensis]
MHPHDVNVFLGKYSQDKNIINQRLISSNDTLHLLYLSILNDQASSTTRSSKKTIDLESCPSKYDQIERLMNSSISCFKIMKFLWTMINRKRQLENVQYKVVEVTDGMGVPVIVNTKYILTGFFLDKLITSVLQ